MNRIMMIAAKTTTLWARLSRWLPVLCIGACIITACSDDEQQSAPPEVKHVTPASGNAGETIRISGTGFQHTPSDNIVAFNGTVADVKSMEGDTVLIVTVPDYATTGPVTVANRFAAASGPVFTRLENSNPPTLVSLSSVTADPGEVVVMTGTNFNNTEIARNQVRVGAFYGSVTQATETELTVTLPARVSPGTQNVTVTINGATSNALKLSINSVPFVAGWFTNSYLNVASDGLPQYAVSLTSDGKYTYIEVPDDSTTNSDLLKYPIAAPTGAFPSAYSASEKAVYLANTNDNILMRVTRGWSRNDFSVIYDGPNMGFDFTYAFAMTEDPASGDLFLVSLDVNTYTNIVSRIHKDGSGITVIASLPYTGSSITGLSVSGRYAYVIEDPGWMAATLHKVALDGSGSVEDLDFAQLPNRRYGIKRMAYSNHDGALYFMFDDNINNEIYGTLSLYRMDEATGSITVVNRDMPQDISDMKILDTDHGAYMFLVRSQTALYFLNLKTAGGVMQQLYDRMYIIPGKAYTIIASNYATQYYPHTLFVDAN